MVEMTDDAVRRLTPHLARIADSEGFMYHRVSAELRAAGRETATAPPATPGEGLESAPGLPR